VVELEESVPWWPEDKFAHPRSERRAGSATGLKREQIVRAALAIAQKDEVEGLTMRAVAESLGVGTMSLYTYVANREELVALMVDAVIGDVALPSEDLPVRAQIMSICSGMRNELARYPALLPRIPFGIMPGPHILRAFDRILGLLRSAGVDDENAVAGVSSITMLTMGSLFEFPSGMTDERRDHGRLRRVRPSALSVEEFPNIVAVAPRLGLASDEHFELALGHLLNGLGDLGARLGE
jgi:AcrR family transcriptional regulator